ncbi:hypothetical protein JCGZ_26239 [Jatropha curcas]|uniref:Pectinesterase inhibitor domain-containing protein n=1 Tax=Jatropha curcas TaxID=180498 RepID=A0A067JHY0_JATCU|nr:pectinesterase inhibitor 9 [Jatropha curcas]KDP22408.1 hypothetical protein JCGZ_26239 [Jatropha curcas]
MEFLTGFFILSLSFFISRAENGTDDFIKSSCLVTRYPDLCYQTLSAYATSIQDNNPTQLANAALNVTLKSAEATSNMVSKMLKAHNLMPKEAAAIKDCVETMRDSVDEIKQSLLVMSDLEGPDFEMKMSNIQTWVSAALTDEDTCMDGFQGNAMNGKVKLKIRQYVERVSQLTSNALALINKVANN